VNPSAPQRREGAQFSSSSGRGKKGGAENTSSSRGRGRSPGKEKRERLFSCSVGDSGRILVHGGERGTLTKKKILTSAFKEVSRSTRKERERLASRSLESKKASSSSAKCTFLKDCKSAISGDDRSLRAGGENARPACNLKGGEKHCFHRRREKRGGGRETRGTFSTGAGGLAITTSEEKKGGEERKKKKVCEVGDDQRKRSWQVPVVRGKNNFIIRKKGRKEKGQTFLRYILEKIGQIVDLKRGGE